MSEHDHNQRRRGRPSVMPIFAEELKRRARAGKLSASQSKQMRTLSDWFARAHPDRYRLKPELKTLRRKLGSLYNELRTASETPREAKA